MGAILIIKDAYTCICSSKIYALISFCIWLLIFIFIIINGLKDEGFICNGKITTAGCFLTVTPLILLDLILVIIDYIKDKKEYENSCKKS